jgi:DNA-binding MarR family transcriptional regulator
MEDGMGAGADRAGEGDEAGLYTGRLLLLAQRDFGERAIAKLRARGHAGLGLAHTALLVHLDAGGARITALAERARITKQAVGQLVADLERQGYVARAVDPRDRRAVLVTYTAAGHRFLADAAAVKDEIEAEYAAILGPDRLRELRATLRALLDLD